MLGGGNMSMVVVSGREGVVDVGGWVEGCRWSGGVDSLGMSMVVVGWRGVDGRGVSIVWGC